MVEAPMPSIKPFHPQNSAFSVTDWESVPRTEHPGETGKAFWKTVEAGGVRVRIVEYTPGYRADHWCDRGHVVLVLEGEIVTELKDGRKYVLRAGASYQVADNADSHRSWSKKGAKLFIID